MCFIKQIMNFILILICNLLVIFATHFPRKPNETKHSSFLTTHYLSQRVTLSAISNRKQVYASFLVFILMAHKKNLRALVKLSGFIPFKFEGPKERGLGRWRANKAVIFIDIPICFTLMERMKKLLVRKGNVKRFFWCILGLFQMTYHVSRIPT